LCRTRADEFLRYFHIERRILEVLGEHPRIVGYGATIISPTYSPPFVVANTFSDTAAGKANQTPHQGFSSPKPVTGIFKNTSKSRTT
jgi:hypothetical protein